MISVRLSEVRCVLVLALLVAAGMLACTYSSDQPKVESRAYVIHIKHHKEAPHQRTSLAILSSPYICIYSVERDMGGDPWRVAAGPHLAIMAELLGELRRGGLNLNVRNPNELAEELVVNWEGTKLWVGRSREGQYFGTDQY